MKPPITLCFLALLATNASAQILNEDFSSGVPPTGWTQVQNNPVTHGWIADGAGRAWHEDEIIGGVSCDNYLVSPPMDLTSASGTWLSFDGETYYANYLANHPISYGDGVSNIEITTDGGLTWIEVWTDTSLNNNDTYSPCIDLSAFDGLANVQVGIHYFGTFAQEWWVDNFLVDDGGCSGPGFTLSVANLTSGGLATLSLGGATANGTVLLGYSWIGAGPTLTRFGLLDLSLPIYLLPTQNADGLGNLRISAGVPVRVANHTLYGQAVDGGSGTLSNSIAEPVL